MTERTLDQLIASLKSEAIEQAEKESAAVLEKAEKHAQDILSAAESQKASLLKEAENEAQAMVAQGKNALRVAARDLTLTVRNELLALFKSTLEKEINATFGPDLIKSVITKVIENVGADAELRIPETSSNELAAYIHQQVTAGDSLSITEDKGLLAGLTITKKDHGWSYDITPEQVMEVLLPLLNDKWVRILTDENKV